MPSDRRRSSTRLKSSDCKAENRSRRSRRSLGPGMCPESQASARSGLLPSRPKRCGPKALGTPWRPACSSASITPGTSPSSEIAEHDVEPVALEVTGLEFVAMARRAFDDDAIKAEPERFVGGPRDLERDGDGLRGDGALVLHPGEASAPLVHAERRADAADRLVGGEVRLADAQKEMLPFAARGKGGDLFDDEVARVTCGTWLGGSRGARRRSEESFRSECPCCQGWTERMCFLIDSARPSLSKTGMDGPDVRQRGHRHDATAASQP